MLALPWFFDSSVLPPFKWIPKPLLWGWLVLLFSLPENFLTPSMLLSKWFVELIWWTDEKFFSSNDPFILVREILLSLMRRARDSVWILLSSLTSGPRLLIMSGLRSVCFKGEDFWERSLPYGDGEAVSTLRQTSAIIILVSSIR